MDLLTINCSAHRTVSKERMCIRTGRPVALLTVTLAVVLSMAGCSGRSRTAAVPSPLPSVARSSAHPTPRFAHCTAVDLALAPGHVTLLQGQQIIGMLLINTGTRPCNAAGFPAVTLYTRSGRALVVHIVKGGSDFGDPTPDPFITLPPKYSVAFNVELAVKGSPCVPIQRMTVRFPDGAISSVLSPDRQSLNVCGPTAHEAAVYLPIFSPGVAQRYPRPLPDSASPEQSPGHA